MGTPLWVTLCFSLSAFQILSLSLTFGILIMMCVGDISKHANIQIIGMPEEEEEQEIENLFEKTMKENFPNLVKEIDM